MSHCDEIRQNVLDLLVEGLAPRGRAEVVAHLQRCRGCNDEWRVLRAVWDSLPAPVMAVPPASVRGRVLAYAREAVVGRQRLLPALWMKVRHPTLPVAWGVLAALLMIALLHLRGAVAQVGAAGVATASLGLAAGLALVVVGLTRDGAPRVVRAVSLAAVGGLAGYVALSLAVPLPAAFELCRVALFGELAMSRGQVCLVYLALAAAYAAIPLALAAYVLSGTEGRWGTGLAEGAVFALLAAPVLVLQAGLDELMITATVLLGLVTGAMVGGLAGTWVRGAKPIRGGR